MHGIHGSLHLRGLLGALISVAALLCIGCAEKVEDECGKTEADEIEPLFRIHYMVTKTGGIPYTGEVNFQSEKHYCGGTVKGVFTDQAATTQNGYWKPITTQYKLANDKDYVRVLFSTATYNFAHAYYYDEVANGMELEDYVTWVFEDTLYVVVPL